MQSRAQANVGFNLNISTKFTATTIYDAMVDLIDALQVYYYYQSIITYHSDAKNKNEGINYLSSLITSTDMDNLAQLNRRLSDTPCPPRLLELIRYLSSNFLSGPCPNSPLLKLSPINIADTMLDGTRISTALSNLKTDANDEVFSLLRRSVPTWTPAVLKDVPTVPLYDANFISIFANTPWCYYSSGTVRCPSASANDTEFLYNAFSNTLDGVAYSLTAIYSTVGGLNQWSPGLLAPVESATASATATPTRRSFYDNGTSKTMRPIPTWNFLKRSRLETYTLNEANTAVITGHLFGAEMCKGFSINALTETTKKAMDYLFSLDMIRTESPNYAGNGNRRRRR